MLFMSLNKILWIFRAILYAPFFGKIGFPSYIGKPIDIVGSKNIFIGKRVRVYPNLRIEVHGENSKVLIEDNVGIAQNVHITSGGVLKIGKGSTILANVFITNIDHNYKKVGIPILEQEHIIKDTSIGENCFIGIGAAIQAGTILGKQCIVGTNSVVRGIFPDYCVIAGNPAKVIKKLNLETGNWEKVC
uniref:Atr6 n=2 Tax=Acinetobacter baumannii TaxID=470 RepID=V5RCJ4_ACIBA|nr:Atr6 [Acinetobacter baumannii]AOX98974.1 Atr6 [Acinetobacter baumannii]ASY01643.1 Atr6 [Acinetobacter baumannii]QEA72108.1 Atr6 [Acinetobacter baumannii]